MSRRRGQSDPRIQLFTVVQHIYIMHTLVKGDLVACYITNTDVIEQLLMWGIVLEVTETLQDVLVLDNLGNTSWYPIHRWTTLTVNAKPLIEIEGFLA